MKLNEKFRYYFLGEPAFYKRLLGYAIPVVAQNFLSSVLNLIDNVMVGALGQNELSAVGQSNQVFFVLSLFLFGISGGVSIFSAQLWGKNETPSIKKVMGIGLVVAGAIALVFTLAGFFAPYQLFTVFTKEEAVREFGVQYLSIVCFSYVITAVSTVFAGGLRSIGQVRLPVVASAIGVAVNTFLNWVLIFGELGMPALGVRGSAIGTVIARVAECAVMLFFAYRKRLPCVGTLGEMFRINRKFVAQFSAIALPVVMNEGLWGLGTTVYTIVFGRMGSDVYSASVIGGTVERIAWIIITSLGTACAIIIGNEIGAGREEKAYKYAVRICYMSMGLAVVMGGLMALSAPLAVLPFNVSDTARGMAMSFIFVYAFAILFKNFNFMAVVGVFRSGGDTRFCFVMDTLGVWLIGVPAALIAGLWLHLPVHWMMLLICGDEYVKYFICIWRLHSRRWINNLTHISRTAGPAPETESA